MGELSIYTCGLILSGLVLLLFIQQFITTIFRASFEEWNEILSVFLVMILSIGLAVVFGWWPTTFSHIVFILLSIVVNMAVVKYLFYLYYPRHQQNETVERYTYSIKVDPGNAKNYKNRADIYQIQGNYQQAIADYTTAIELNPHFKEAYYQRGMTYAQIGLREEASADFDKGFENSNSHQAIDYYLYGKAYLDIPMYDHVVFCLTKALELGLNAEQTADATKILAQIRHTTHIPE